MIVQANLRCTIAVGDIYLLLSLSLFNMQKVALDKNSSIQPWQVTSAKLTVPSLPPTTTNYCPVCTKTCCKQLLNTQKELHHHMRCYPMSVISTRIPLRFFLVYKSHLRAHQRRRSQRNKYFRVYHEFEETDKLSDQDNNINQ